MHRDQHTHDHAQLNNWWSSSIDAFNPFCLYIPPSFFFLNTVTLATACFWPSLWLQLRGLLKDAVHLIHQSVDSVKSWRMSERKMAAQTHSMKTQDRRVTRTVKLIMLTWLVDGSYWLKVIVCLTLAQGVRKHLERDWCYLSWSLGLDSVLFTKGKL